MHWNMIKDIYKVLESENNNIEKLIDKKKNTLAALTIHGFH